MVDSTARKRRGEVVMVSSTEEEEEETETETETETDGSCSREDGDEGDDDDDYFDDDEDEDDDDDYDDEEERKDNCKRRGKAKNDKPLGVAEEGQNFDRVVGLLKSRKDLGKLKLEECRAYLRKLNLRVTGTKAICIQRIQEHWRIKDGNGERLYPRSSFNINCRGDVCKGDVILFKQRVYEKFDIVSRGANIIGKRTIAGRVVKESYGAAKQQHTFTVEILWSEGVKVLPASFPLLVKGRNLYRLKTFRQRWNDEAERSKVLSEKHKRGAAARHVRAIKARQANKGPKCQISSSGTSPRKRQRKMPELNTKPAKQNKRHTNTQHCGHRAKNQTTASHFLEPSATQSRHLHFHESTYNERYAFSNSSHPQAGSCYMNRAPPVHGNALHGPYALNNRYPGGHTQMPHLPACETNSSAFNRNNHARQHFSNHIPQFGPMNLAAYHANGLDLAPNHMMPSVGPTSSYHYASVSELPRHHMIPSVSRRMQVQNHAPPPYPSSGYRPWKRDH